MIQRKQSLYLLLAAGIQAYFAFGTYFKYVADGLTFALTGSGIINIKNAKWKKDLSPIDKNINWICESIPKLPIYN